MSTILLKIKGPMQSWGTSSHFNTRHTDYYPSKSGIIGMIAACLGYRRDEDEKIRELNKLNFAVRIDRQGGLLRDYQIARGCKPNGDSDKTKIYVTNRYYLEDSEFIVAIGSEDENMMEKIEYALKYPYFQPFMGRRSCPVQWDYFIGKFEGDLMQILSNYKRLDETKALTIYADANLIKDGNRKMRKDYVVSFSQQERKFKYRFENKKILKASREKEEHDAFGGIGE